LGEAAQKLPILQLGIPAVLSLYFDVFSGILQAFIFCMLTMLYIASAAETEDA
jgi:ATP synthase subunit a